MAKEQISYSIVLPVYNSEFSIRRAIDSVLNQSFDAWEMIIVDDMSTDDSYSIAVDYSQRDKRIQAFRLNKNSGGPAWPRNLGIKCSNNNWVAFLDSDDWWYPNKLEVVSNFINDKSKIIYHNLDLHKDLNGPVKELKSRKLHVPIFQDLMLKGNTLMNSATVVRRDYIIKAGGLSESAELIGVEDFDLWLKLSKLINEATFISQSLGAYWVGSGNHLTENSQKQINRIQAVYNIHRQELNPKESKIAEARVYRELGDVFFRMGDFQEARNYYLRAILLKFRTRIFAKLIISIVKQIK